MGPILCWCKSTYYLASPPRFKAVVFRGSVEKTKRNHIRQAGNQRVHVAESAVLWWKPTNLYYPGFCHAHFVILVLALVNFIFLLLQSSVTCYSRITNAGKKGEGIYSTFLALSSGQSWPSRKNKQKKGNHVGQREISAFTWQNQRYSENTRRLLNIQGSAAHLFVILVPALVFFFYFFLISIFLKQNRRWLFYFILYSILLFSRNLKMRTLF